MSWRVCEEFPDYAVSSDGHIMRINPGTGHAAHARSGKILHQVLDRYGYPQVCIRRDKRKSACTVHRLIAKAFVPNPDNKPQVNHLDGNKQNNHFSNLEWATNLENMRHANRTGLNLVKRADNPNAKLTEANVTEIRSLYALRGLSQAKIAQQFGVNQTSISRIVLNQTWGENHA